MHSREIWSQAQGTFVFITICQTCINSIGTAQRQGSAISTKSDIQYIRPTLVETRLLNMEKYTVNPMAKVYIVPWQVQDGDDLGKVEMNSRHQEAKHESF